MKAVRERGFFYVLHPGPSPKEKGGVEYSIAERGFFVVSFFWGNVQPFGTRKYLCGVLMTKRSLILRLN
jgi:hypothetical protein